MLFRSRFTPATSIVTGVNPLKPTGLPYLYYKNRRYIITTCIPAGSLLQRLRSRNQEQQSDQQDQTDHRDQDYFSQTGFLLYGHCGLVSGERFGVGVRCGGFRRAQTGHLLLHALRTVGGQLGLLPAAGLLRSLPFAGLPLLLVAGLLLAARLLGDRKSVGRERV